MLGPMRFRDLPRALPLQFRRAMYASRGGFLLRPFAIALALGALGLASAALESAARSKGEFLRDWFDPQIAQVFLSDVATSIMTVVSIVFAILLMTLTLASMQFSPRILLNFVRDRVTQWTLGIFLGTFCYCMAVLPSLRFEPDPFAPTATLLGAMLLTLTCVGWLLFFIHHISHAISVNHMVDRIARDTEDVIRKIAPHPRGGMAPPAYPDRSAAEPERSFASRETGYIRYIDAGALLGIAAESRVRVRIHRRVGQFIVEGVPVFSVAPAARLDATMLDRLYLALDIGPVRTLQQDVEFGVLQIVDIALRAISPAVNDPSTAIGCIDQLSRLIVMWMSRTPPPLLLSRPPHVVRVILPWISSQELLETAFDQIRHYAAADVAVSLRLLRALDDIASTTPDVAPLLDLASQIVERRHPGLGQRDVARLEARLESIITRASSADSERPRG